MFSIHLMDFLFMPYLIIGICAALVVACSFQLFRRPNLDHIPVVGHSSLLASYWFTKGLEVDLAQSVQEGYDKYKSRAFRIANLTHWVVCLPRSDLECVVTASEDHLSFFKATEQSLKIKYTLGVNMNETRHQQLIRSRLTHNLPVLYTNLRDEIIAACNEFLDPKYNEWKSVLVLRATLKIVGRASNRAIVGLPLCRDPDWLDFNINYPQAIVSEARKLRLFPNFMLPLVAKFVTRLSRRTKQGVALISPLIKERLQHMEAEGTDWCDKPNDYLQWWLDTSQETCPILLMRRMLSVNFTAIHSTSLTFSQALLKLAENPQYAQVLRDEVEAVVNKHGWTKDALSEMRKFDSFFKETQRFEGMAILALPRIAMSDLTLADGTFIPQGTTLAFPVHRMHHDDAVFENPDTFEPFRFAKTRSKELNGAGHQMTTLGPDVLLFGLGTHACPGRFFAATVLKTMLAHIVMSYDVKLEDDTFRPQALRIGRSIVPNPTAKVMFRKRVE
ncbi:cytochrome P450 [Pisolithus microcarpus]|nr:cytochrome P450 [Pisolithus microcarpus]